MPHERVLFLSSSQPPTQITVLWMLMQGKLKNHDLWIVSSLDKTRLKWPAIRPLNSFILFQHTTDCKSLHSSWFLGKKKKKENLLLCYSISPKIIKKFQKVENEQEEQNIQKNSFRGEKSKKSEYCNDHLGLQTWSEKERLKICTENMKDIRGSYKGKGRHTNY